MSDIARNSDLNIKAVAQVRSTARRSLVGRYSDSRQAFATQIIAIILSSRIQVVAMRYVLLLSDACQPRSYVRTYLLEATSLECMQE